MPTPLDAVTLKSWLSDGREIAFLDVREAGEFGEAHPFFAIPLPYSRLETALPGLVPNPQVRLVLTDGGDGVAERAAGRAEALGYRNVHVLTGGAPGWKAAGYTLYAGVNVPSKTFGELVEEQRHTPRVTADEVEAMRKAGDNFIIVDGRPFSEYQKMNIPGGVCCPNGELVLRIAELAPDPTTRIVVNCAGRTRSIIGAQTLIDFGVPNPVVALENGTQGWFLAGLQLERGADRKHSLETVARDHARQQARAREVATARGVSFLDTAKAQAWLDDASRTTYLLDVRTPEEATATPVAGAAHAPGGQLIQATDQWVGVKGARMILVDGEEVRAPVVAAWLRQLGHEANVLAGGTAAASRLSPPRRIVAPQPAAPTPIGVSELSEALKRGAIDVIDLRPGMTYRKGHIPGAVWSIRPRIGKAVRDPAKPVVLVAEDASTTALAALDLAAAGVRDVRALEGGQAAWVAAKLPVEASPGTPSDADCIDFLFFTAKRHDGDAAARAASEQYLSWEIGLVGQLDAQERGVFRITPI